MTHQFDVDEAVAFGVPEAIMLQSLRIWQAGNAVNGTHYYQGRTWVRMPVHRMLPYFPYWKNHRAIYRILESLVNQKAVLTDNFNICRRNRTRFYSVADQASVPLTDTVSSLSIPASVMQQLQIEQDDEDQLMPTGEATPADQLTDLSNGQNTPSGQLTNLSNEQLTDLSNEQNEPDLQLTEMTNANVKNGDTGIIVDSIKVNKDIVSSGGGKSDEQRIASVGTSAPPPPVPDFILANRQQLEAHQHIDADEVWCRYMGNDHSRASLKKTILHIYRGARGETFAMQNKVKVDEPLVDAFIEQRLMNEDIPSQRNLHRLLEWFVGDMREAATRRPAPVKGTPYDSSRPVDFGSYEID